MKNMELLSGFVAAPFTPMDEKGNINLEPIPKYVETLISNGICGAFICGTTGEGASLTTEERKLIAEEWVRCAGGSRLKIIVHVGGVCQTDCITLAKHASVIGAFAIAAIAPYFFKPETTDDLLMFFKPIADGAPGLPFYYYHMPSMTGVYLPVSDFLVKAGELMANFAGVKYTHSDMMDMQQCIEISKGRFEIFNGFDEMLICGLSLGTTSAVGSTYNFMPSVYIDLFNAFNSNDIQKARELQQYSVKVVQILKKFGGALRSGKAIMELIGVSCGPCRPPIRSMTDIEKACLKKELEDISFFKTIKYNI
jgi:N-acetylneuraminate lyase